MNSERHAKTLRELAGLPIDPPFLADATLLVIDAQVAYSAEGALAVEGGVAATQRIAELLDRARSAGTQIIHISHRGVAGSAFDPLHGGRFITAVEPIRGEDVVHKTLPNAFAGTDLLQLISNGTPRPIVLCGFMTHMCVSSTARAALDLGLDTTIASDATATRDLPATTGPDVIAAVAVHEAALAALADRFSVVATTRRILNGP